LVCLLLSVCVVTFFILREVLSIHYMKVIL
jgi:hypothetical protein